METQREVCHDCGAKEGEIHSLGCDMELCSRCGAQLITCNCCYKQLGLDPWEEPTFSKGLNEEQDERWQEILNEEGRVPYVDIPVLCRLCGEKYPEFFYVPDEEWRKFVIPPLQKEILCKQCYDKMKKLFPNGWKMVKRQN